MKLLASDLKRKVLTAPGKRGKPFKDDDGNDMTVGAYCALALAKSQSRENEQVEKIRRGVLAQKLIRITEEVGNEETELELTAEQVKRIKTCINDTCDPWVVVQIYQVIDPDCVKDDGG